MYIHGREHEVKQMGSFIQYIYFDKYSLHRWQRGSIMGDEWFVCGGRGWSLHLIYFLQKYKLTDQQARALYTLKNDATCLNGVCIIHVIFYSCIHQTLILLGLFKVTGVTQVKKGDEGDLKIAVYRQPVVTAVDASHSSFQLYRSGVYYEPRCSSTRLDHALLVVGYGTLDGKDFWIAKNSWGWFIYI